MVTVLILRFNVRVVLFVGNHINDVPGGAHAQEFGHQAGVHDVTAALGYHLPQYWHPE